jgi:hypothetical protein
MLNKLFKNRQPKTSEVNGNPNIVRILDDHTYRRYKIGDNIHYYGLTGFVVDKVPGGFRNSSELIIVTKVISYDGAMKVYEKQVSQNFAKRVELLQYLVQSYKGSGSPLTALGMAMSIAENTKVDVRPEEWLFLMWFLGYRFPVLGFHWKFYSGKIAGSMDKLRNFMSWLFSQSTIVKLGP